MQQGLLITFALPCIGLGGAEIVSIRLAKHFLSLGFRVDFVTGWDGPEEQPILPDGARHIVLGAQQTRGVLLPFAKYLLRERPYGVVASMWPFTTICALANRLVWSRARMLVCEHNTLSIQYGHCGPLHHALLKKSIAFSYPLADMRVAVSGGVADDLASLSGIARDKIVVVYNPLLISPGTAADAVAAETVWGGWRGPRIITVGRFKAQKNHPLLIRAFKKMLATHDARLLILGTGEQFEATTAIARAEGVADKVLMPGAVPDPMPYYRSADLFALSSDYEGFGNVIVEALGCGLPIVSTDCRSGPSEILENGRLGRLVPVGDADAMARAMVEALAAAHDREALKRRAADFAPERIAGQYLKLLFPQALSAGAAANAK